MISFSSIPNRTILARIYYGAVLLFLLHRFSSHALLSQLENPVLNYVNIDFTYITLFFSGLSGLLTQHHSVALAFDTTLFIITLIAFALPSLKYIPVIFSILLGLYEVTGYTFLCFHKHNLTGVWWCSLMFWVIDEKGFVPLFYLTRYYCLFIYASSGFWKFYRSVWHLPGHFPVIIKNDALIYLIEHPAGIRAQAISWLIIHPSLLDQLMIFSCIAQLAFAIGFFTRRLDWFFFLFALGFHIISFYLMQAYFLEFSIILITLLPLPFLYKADKRYI